MFYFIYYLSFQIDALTLENKQLKKTVSELKQILNTCRSSLDVSTNNQNVNKNFE